MVRAKLTWKRSVSLDVVGQQLDIEVNGVNTQYTLTGNVEEMLVELNPGDVVHASLFAYNLVFRSPFVSLDFTVPTIPEAPTDFAVEFVQE